MYRLRKNQEMCNSSGRDPGGGLSNNRQILNTWILLTLFIVFVRDHELSIIFE